MFYDTLFARCSCAVNQEAAVGGGTVTEQPSKDGEDGHGEHLSSHRRAHKGLEVHQIHHHQRQLHCHHHQLHYRGRNVCLAV